MTDVRYLPHENPVENAEGDSAEARASGTAVNLQVTLMDDLLGEVVGIYQTTPEGALALASQLIAAAEEAASRPITM